LKRKFDTLIDTIGAQGGVHQKLAARLEPIFKDIERIADEIDRYNAKRKRLRTWKDSNAFTLYLDT
jgi:hypothetical protein